MKKILLASTAIVGFAGAASAAEITLSGYAEVGIAGGEAVETQFHNDWQVNFNFSGSTDNGLEFGGKVQIEESNSPYSINGGLRIDDEAFWVSGAFGKVTLGETDGAFDWALSEIYTGTGLQDDHSTHAGAYWFTGLDGGYDNQIARYEYSFGDFAVAVSAEMDDGRTSGFSTSTVTATTSGGATFNTTIITPTSGFTSGRATGDTTWSIGGKWSGNMSGVDLGVGIGYQDNGTNSVWGLSGSAGFSNGFSVALGYADLDGTGDAVTGDGVNPAVDSWWGIGVAYTPATMSALTIGVNYGVYEAATAGDDDPSGWGIVANYDLGGGAVAMASYGASSGSDSTGADYGSGNGNGTETFSIGLGLSF
ncbi:porin [Defluviimonas aestuarii]|uniref:porin n=1 Tax=Albidovulum aestuarii TaxID=1130726 RepID=UPI00249C70A8|nr:porin [Defluviimonas aestuarii]MDI3338651.1 porin [Defluviimonas aestuarii]